VLPTLQQQETLRTLTQLSAAWLDSLAPLRSRFQRALDGWISRTLPLVIGYSLHRNLQGVWVRGDSHALQNARPLLVAANHHSWWDGYAIWLLRKRLGISITIMMADWQLERFSFFRQHGVISQRELRRAIRLMQTGEALVIFPEGKLCPTGQVGAVAEGMAFLAQHSGAQVLPLALRTVLRGGQYPEMYIDIGTPVDTQHWHQAINQQLEALDACIAASDPETPLAGFSLWFGGQRSFHEQTTWLTSLRQRGSKQSTIKNTTHDTHDQQTTNG
jgi:hypothetical protein